MPRHDDNKDHLNTEQKGFVKQMTARVPWFRQPLKLTEPVDGSFLKVRMARPIAPTNQADLPIIRCRSPDYLSVHAVLPFPYHILPLICRLAGQNSFAHCSSCIWQPVPLCLAAPPQILLVVRQGLQDHLVVKQVSQLDVAA